MGWTGQPGLVSLVAMRALLVGCLCLLSTACSLDVRGRGQSCQRTAQCALGLACVEGTCSKDLGPIADQSTVPDLGGGGDAAVVDAALGDAGGVAADGG